IERDEDQGETLVEGERPHVALERAHLDICSPGASFGPPEHSGGTIEADDVVALLRDRHRDTAGAAAELEDRASRPARESAEPLDVGPALERGDPEIVESREACCLRRVALGAEPVTRFGRREPPSRASGARRR